MDLTVLGVLEFNTVAVGIAAMDAMVKAAPVSIVDAKTLCPGKYIILITGDVASVDASLTRGKETGKGHILDELFLPNLHPQIIPAITGTSPCEIWDAIAVVETFSVISSIEAGDIAAKVADVTIPEIRLAMGLGGKSYVKMIGSLNAIEEAVEAALGRIGNKGLLCGKTIIPKPHADIRPFFI